MLRGGNMSASTLSLPSRRRSDSVRRARKTRRFALNCESLESRQLLSIGQTGLAAGILVNPSVASSQLSIPATVSNFNPPSYLNAEIQFGTFGGLNSVQVVFFGSGPLFAPTPTPSSSGGSSFSLGTLGGNSGSGNSQTGLTFTSGTSSITALNPGATSITNTNSPGSVVFVVPPPLAPLPVHLGASTAPTTAQSNSTFISNLDELPQITHFGQADDFAGHRLFMENPAAKPQSASFIDYVEPFRVIAPAAPAAQPLPQGNQAPAPDAAQPRALPAISDPDIDAALDLTDARVLTRSRDGGDSRPADEQLSHTNTSWSFSAIFGAAAIATAGYHLVMREADRVRGRWIPRWAGAERPTKRKVGSPPR
jgi:hypothetical protein